MTGEAANLIKMARDEGRNFMLEHEAKAVLRSYGISVTQDMFCRTPDEAVHAARRIGYPVAMKIVSPQIVHKTEFGGVRLNIANDEDVKSAFDEMFSSARKRLGDFDFRGVLVSEMVRGHEMIIGSTRDAQFGQMIMFGIGGINVEVFRDVSYRLVPIEEIDALEMISELKGKKLIEGYRGSERVDTNIVVSTLLAVSRLLCDFDEIEEMDLNPVFGNAKGVKVADARIFLTHV
ncbi:MAG: acetate--CoA ligase family protein [Methanomassiliicoccales archaeon]|jgi:acetyltransferase|nr:acetate--CoA ligase family protein [Methanomassiliicoccales archaeon]